MKPLSNASLFPGDTSPDEERWLLVRHGEEYGEGDYAYLSNGWLGVRVPPRGGVAAPARARCFIAGLRYGEYTATGMDVETSEYPRVVHLPDWTRIGIAVGEGGRPLLGQDAVAITQTLDLWRAEVLTRLTFCSPEEAPLREISQWMFIDQNHAGLAVQGMTLTASREIVIGLSGTIEMDTAEGFEKRLNPERLGRDGLVVRTRTLPLRNERLPRLANAQTGLTIASRLIVIPEPGLEAGSKADERHEGLGLKVRLRAGESVTLLKATLHLLSTEDEHASLEWFSGLTCDEILQLRIEHRRAWQKRWSSRVEVSNRDWARRINAAQFSLKASLREGAGGSAPPMGLSNESWRGFVFPWDATLWILPYFLATEPHLARRMLDFEVSDTTSGISRLDYYRRGEGIKMYEGGCVAYAAWNYYRVTGDLEWLNGNGLSIFKAVCEGYRRRALFNPSLGKYELRQVWPVDEYAPKDCDNSIFTNALATVVVQRACEVLALLGRRVPEDLGAMAKHGFWLPYSTEDQRHIEYASWSEGGMARAYQGEMIKQAEALLLAWPLEIETRPEVIRNDLDYYVPRTRQGPAMGWGIYTACAAKVEDMDLMEQCLIQSSRHMRTPFHIFHECQEGDGSVFITGCADLLQGILFGCAGLRPGGENVPPHLPGFLGKIRLLKIQTTPHQKYSVDLP